MDVSKMIELKNKMSNSHDFNWNEKINSIQFKCGQQTLKRHIQINKDFLKW